MEIFKLATLRQKKFLFIPLRGKFLTNYFKANLKKIRFFSDINNNTNKDDRSVANLAVIQALSAEFYVYVEYNGRM